MDRGVQVIIQNKCKRARNNSFSKITALGKAVSWLSSSSWIFHKFGCWRKSPCESVTEIAGCRRRLAEFAQRPPKCDASLAEVRDTEHRKMTNWRSGPC